MASELRVAAERLRRINDWTNPLEVYGGEDYAQDYSADVQAVVDDYLAEHRADDEEPITDEWLQSVGFHLSASAWRFCDVLLEPIPASIANPHFTGWRCKIGDRWVSVFSNRRDVRQICIALGGPLEAPA